MESFLPSVRGPVHLRMTQTYWLRSWVQVESNVRDWGAREEKPHRLQSINIVLLLLTGNSNVYIFSNYKQWTAYSYCSGRGPWQSFPLFSNRRYWCEFNSHAKYTEWYINAETLSSQKMGRSWGWKDPEIWSNHNNNLLLYVYQVVKKRQAGVLHQSWPVWPLKLGKISLGCLFRFLPCYPPFPAMKFRNALTNTLDRYFISIMGELWSCYCIEIFQFLSVFNFLPGTL